MQRDFIEKGGFGDSLGNDVARLEAIIPATARLIALFREQRLAHRPHARGAQARSQRLPTLARSGAATRHLHIGEAGAMGRLLVARRAGQPDRR